MINIGLNVLDKFSRGKRIAIVAGINNYKEPNIPQLAAAENNARELFNLLTSQAKFDNNIENLLLNEYATQRNIINRINESFNTYEKLDIALFYFSGYINLNKNGDLYLLTSDINNKNSSFCGIIINDLIETLYSSGNNQNMIIILDCCILESNTEYTSVEKAKMKNFLPLLQKNIENITNKKHYGENCEKFTVTSWADDTVSWSKLECIDTDNDKPHVHSAFTFYLLEGLRGRAADVNSGIITVESLKFFIDYMSKNEYKFFNQYINQSRDIDNLIISLSVLKYQNHIKNIVNKITEYTNILYLSNPEILNIINATKNLNELKSLQPSNESIIPLQEMVQYQLNSFKDRLFQWYYSLSKDIKIMLEKNTNGLIKDIIDSVYTLELDNLFEYKFLKYLPVINDEFRNRNTLFEHKLTLNIQLFAEKLFLVKTIPSARYKANFEINENRDSIYLPNTNIIKENINPKSITYIEEHSTNQRDSKKNQTDVNEEHSNENQIERYPCARFPEEVVLSEIVPLEVIIKTIKPLSLNYDTSKITLQIGKENQKEIPVDVIVGCYDDGFVIEWPYVSKIYVPVELKDSKPIIFKVKPKKEGKHKIYIHFYQGASLVGKIEIERIVLKSKIQGPVFVSANDIQITEVKSDKPISESIFPIPDVTILIHERKLSSNFEYNITLIEPNGVHEVGPIEFQFNPETKFHKIFEDIENLRAPSVTIIDRKIKAKGMSLFEELFPSALKELYWEMHYRIKSIRVMSKESWIPWEIIKPWRKLQNGNIEEDDFLCERYAFSRWTIGKYDIFKEKIKRIKVVIPNDTNLNAAIKERRWIEEFAKSKNLKISVDSSYEQLIDTLETEKEIDILHFSTHGQSNKESPLLSAIELEEGVQLRVEEIVGNAMTFGQSHPIVILNACQTGNQGFSLTGIQGWATRFLEAGASVFIGTLWSVNDETAFNFVKEFYEQLTSGISLGESVKNARNICKKQGDTSWLAYQLYGHPNSTIKF